MRNIVIALIISVVLIGGVIAFIISNRDRPEVDIGGPATPQGKATVTAKEVVKPGRKVERLPQPSRDKVRVEVAVTTDRGEPVANARVRIDSEEELKSGRRDIMPVAEFLTNASGLGVPKDKLDIGSYVVWAEASGYARARQLVTVAKGEEPVKVKVVLTSGVAITGRVFAKDRTPIKGARVVAFKELGKKDGTDFDWLMGLLEPKTLEKPLSMDETDASGSYTLSNLEKGTECVVRAAADGFSPGSKGFVAAGTPNVDFYLETGGRLTGQVVATNGAPVSGAKIDAYKKSGQTSDIREAVRDAMSGAVDSVTTGGDGRFVFGTLGQGMFTLIASGRGHQEAQKDVDLKLGVEVKVAITLEDGLVLAGRVLGPNGSPVPDAKVSVRPQAAVSGGNNSIVRETDKDATTDAGGRFEFDSLSAGQCTLTVSHAQLAATQVRDVEVPQENLEITLTEGAAIEGKVTDEQGNPIGGVRLSVQDIGTVNKEAVTGDDGRYVLSPLSVKPINKKQVQAVKDGWAQPEVQTASVTEGTVATIDFVLTRNSRIAGTVTDKGTGKPVPGARVLVEKLVTKENPVHRFLDYSYTKDDGTFELPRIVPSAQVRLVVDHPYYSSWASNSFDIGAGEDLSDTDIALEAGASITGEVVNEAGVKLARADVKAVKAGDPDTRDFLGASSTKTDEQGTFTLKGLSTGKYEIVAQLGGYLDGRSEGIDLTEGAARSGVRVRLATARSVSGTVTDARGKAIGAVRITVIDASASTRKESGVSDEDGKWTVGGLGPEPVEIQAEVDGFAKHTLRDVPTGKNDVAIQLMALGGVKGIVVDTEGKPVKAFSAKGDPIETDAGYETPRTSFKTFSGDEGAFELGNLAPGSYTINVQAPGYRGVQAANIRVSAGDVADVGTLTLETGGALRGRVIDASGAPVPDATVSVIGGSSRLASTRGAKSETTTTTDADGRFLFENLKAGSTKFRATRPGFLAGESDPVDPNAMTGEVVITLGVSGAITGVVINGRKEPLANIKVYLKGDPKSAQTATDGQGRFAFEELPAGKYTVRTFSFVKPGEERPQEAVLDLEVAAGQSVDVELVKN